MKHRSHKWLMLIAGSILILAVSTFSQERDEDYEVYDAVMQHMFAGGVRQSAMNAKADKILIRDHTNSEYAYGPNREMWDEVKLRLRLLTDEVIADYESKRKGEKELRSVFKIPFEYSLISDGELKKIFGDPREHVKTDQTWTKFYERYPGSAGYNSLSRVGFDKEKRRALVYFVNWCGSLCGTGSYLLLEKIDGNWTVQERVMIWIS
jgi:hypothetical protein